jgi:hypothetical protein
VAKEAKGAPPRKHHFVPQFYLRGFVGAKDQKNRIARQRESIASAYENGYPTVLPVALLRALEENLRSLEKARQIILDEQKATDGKSKGTPL